MVYCFVTSGVASIVEHRGNRRCVFTTKILYALLLCVVSAFVSLRGTRTLRRGRKSAQDLRGRSGGFVCDSGPALGVGQRTGCPCCRARRGACGRGISPTSRRARQECLRL